MRRRPDADPLELSNDLAPTGGDRPSIPRSGLWAGPRDDGPRHVSQPLMQRGQQSNNEARISIQGDPDIVRARRSARDLASRVGFSRTDLTMIATAVSEIARNIVRFAGNGEVVIEILDSPRRGVRVVARDTGPGIPDLTRALTDGYSTYQGLGLGLPGARRLMDEFSVISEVGRGTTVTMTKWRTEGRP